MAKMRRRPGERVLLHVRARASSLLAISRNAGVNLVSGATPDGRKWSIDGADNETMRVRYGSAVVDIPIGELLGSADAAINAEYDDEYGLPLAEASMFQADGTRAEQRDDTITYGNERYTVLVQGEDEDGPLHISVHGHDRDAHIPWRILQRIKNEVAGEDRWACEWFPPESSLMDEANERHLWVWPTNVPPPAPLAYHGPRTVADESEAREYGARQDPLPEWYPETKEQACGS